jgi:putative colanic acid biosysnthesis UDP-glucose lipid carrier transferase
MKTIEAMEDSNRAYRMTQEYAAAAVAADIAVEVAVEQTGLSPPLANFAGTSASGLGASLLAPGNYLRIKRFHDIIFSLGFLLVGGIWLFPLIALAIRLDSRGPVFFRQQRVGWQGRHFHCLKFRTMTHDPGAGFVQAQKDDPRVTRVGRFLRKTNLDELPQFFNVLGGDMSVVGPRPHVSELDLIHSGQVPGYRLRNTVRPGVTGLAQVSGCRGETRNHRDMQHRIRFDLFYVRNMSFMLDVKIIFLTILRVLQGDSKAY